MEGSQSDQETTTDRNGQQMEVRIWTSLGTPSVASGRIVEDEVGVVDGAGADAEAGHPVQHGEAGGGEAEVGGVDVEEERVGAAVGRHAVREHVVEERRGVGGAAGLGERQGEGGVLLLLGVGPPLS